ncbi:hypothetical protein [Chitinophaga sp. HK235]|uniref:hypothetical protein n=1 Tax=Chitinophaga sp. HK235 TaxID=2952571 RepID=UPI001BA5B952|nr:hypothetical protein [Chitinophaga sp. HK235]
MKALTCILVALLLLSATPASVEKRAPTSQGNVTVHVWFYYPRSGAVIGICALPIWEPLVYVYGVTTVNVNCPSSSVVVNVSEGDTVYCSTSIYLKWNVVWSDVNIITADEIGAGSIDLIIEQ